MILAMALCLVLLPLALWVGVVLLQAICSLLPAPAAPLSSARPRIAILIPAHDEAAGILATLRTLLPQLQPGDRLLVVADNCSDDTSGIATAAGAEVVRRDDPARRGKGFALDFGVRHLAADPPQVLISVDADCKVEAGAIDLLARACMASSRPVQAAYLMHRPQARNALGDLRTFAWRFRNLVRPLGWRRLGQPCQLMGTGMAFPWALIAQAPLATADLVEDMVLGVHLAQRGAAPLFCPQAVVHSAFPTGGAGLRRQRRRWEHGHLGMVLGAPRMVLKSLGERNSGLLALALDLSVPPLALLLLALLAVTVTSAFVSQVLAAVAACLLLLLATAILLAWWRHGRGTVSLCSLLLAPAYALVKLPLYAGFVLRRQMDWERSSRE